MQATLLSKLESLDSRVQNLEENLIFQSQPSPHYSPPHSSPLYDPTDPKGKRPLFAPPPSPPPERSKQVLSPHSSPLHDPQPSPQLSPQHSPSATLLLYRFTYEFGLPFVTLPQSPIPPSPILEPQPSPQPSPIHLTFPLSQFGSPTIAFPSSPIPINTFPSSPIHLDISSSTSANRYVMVVLQSIPQTPSSSTESEATISDQLSPPHSPPSPT